MQSDGPQSWGMGETAPVEGDPFALARASCRHAAQVARDVSIDEVALRRFVTRLEGSMVRDVLAGHMGENCDTMPEEFGCAREAVNFAVLFALLQFGHGFRYELHRLCGRGASQTITLGVRALHATGDLSAAHLRRLTAADVHQAFQLPRHPDVGTLVKQLQTVLYQAGTVLALLGVEDFAAFVQRTLSRPESAHAPAATMVQQLAYHFPAFNDQGVLHDGSRVVLMKKATLAVGELRRLAASHDGRYRFEQDFDRPVAPVDNVIPAMLVYHGILRLSPTLHQRIHEQRVPLPRGPQEAELRAVALDVCERIVAATGGAFTALDLGYYLWRSGKEPGARQFARHHTQDTVFY